MNGWSWHKNRDICKRQGGDLVSIETEDEWNFISDEIQRRNKKKSYKHRWSIGLTKKAGNWTWVSGRPLTIFKWGKGEPSGEHNAALMYKRSSNDKQGVFVSDNSRISGEAYICEYSNGKFFCFVLFFLFFAIFSFCVCLFVCLVFDNNIFGISHFFVLHLGYSFADSASGQKFSQESYQAYVGSPCTQLYGKKSWSL